MPPSKIFIVEDEILIAHSMQRLLTRVGYDVWVETDASCVLDAVEQTPPDLILMDIHLNAGIDGVELAENIRTRHAMPIIFITAHSDEDTIQRAKATRPAGYLLKPIDFHQLRIAAEVALTLRETEKQAQFHQQKEREQRELTETLVQVSQALTSSLDIEVVLDTILDQLARIVPHDVSNVILLEGEQPRVLRTHGFEQFDAQSFIETFVFPLEGESIRHYIVETGQPVVVKDIRADHRWRLDEGFSWLRSYVAVPICLGGQVIGLLNVGASQPDFYDETHGKWMSAFAAHAAIALQNARLFGQAHESAARLEFLSHRLLTVQEAERRYLARELHDEVGQALTAARLSLQTLSRADDRSVREKKMRESLEIIDLALLQVRNMSLDLRPSMLDDLGLLPALRWFVERESRWAQLDAKIIVVEDSFPRLASDLELVCFRIAQESITNIVRHARATRMTLTLDCQDGLVTMTIQDDGQGFDLAEAMQRAGRGQSLGLMGMQERASLMGGTLTILSAAGQGARIDLRLPLRTENAPEERTL